MLSPGSGNTVIKSKLISRRMFILSLGKIVVFTGIVGRLVSLQITESKKYKTLSDKNRFREWKLAPERGIIKDYFNNEIASNSQVYQIHLIPENTQSLEEVFFRLKGILNISDQKIFSLRKKIAKQKPWIPVIISDNLTWSEFSRVNLFLQDRLMGHYIEIEDESWLDYKKGDFTIIEPNKTHLVANLGYEARFTMQLTGYAKQEDIT